MTTKMKSRLVLVAACAAAFAAGAGCTGMAAVGQPHMQNALAALQTARSELQVAERNKGGHRANALGLVNQAITEVEAGIAVGEGG
ncbi:MAG TPA: hypothetical protein VKU90_07095 [Caulobacteraceae bacterium]|jgi:hypothetical protein|nr:hypothetical protein [Caulobacteraceae bacterium]